MKFCLTACCGLLIAFSFGQPCRSVELIEKMDVAYPGYKAAANQAFTEALSLAQLHAGEKTGDPVYRIPVVVHVVYTSPQENIPDSVIFSQIAVLNEDYRRLNPDTVNTRGIFLPIAQDPGMEFFLATTDPQGNPTNGIVRVAGSPSLGSFLPIGDEMKAASTGGSDAWPTDKYLNIWVCNMLGGFVLGYAYPPVGNVPNWPTNSAPPDSALQGVVLQYNVVGRNNPYASGGYDIVNRGRTATHEIGHFFGLRHIWGDGDCTQDDGIMDTPDAAADAGQTCNFTKNTCTENPGPEMPDNIENYMDYAADSCMNMFTHGQVDLMRSILENFRPGLIAGVVSVNEQEAVNGQIQLYPMPSGGLVNIANMNHIEIAPTATITDISGRSSQVVNIQQNRMDLTGFPPGIYVIKLETEKGTVLKKIVLM